MYLLVSDAKSHGDAFHGSFICHVNRFIKSRDIKYTIHSVIYYTEHIRARERERELQVQSAANAIL